MFQRILVVLDSPEVDQCIFNAVLAFARSMQAQLLLLEVTPPTANRRSTRPSKALATDVDQTSSLYEALHAMGMTVAIAQVTGEPIRESCQFAASWNADLMIVCQRVLMPWNEENCDSLEAVQRANRMATLKATIPCSLLVIQNQIPTNTISFTMLVKPKMPNYQMERQRLEALLSLP